MNIQDLIVQTLKEEVVPAIGCTEPVAVALACAKARELLDTHEVNHVKVIVSPNIYKNGLAVGVPPTDQVGLDIAAALGIVGGNSEKNLQVLAGIGPEEICRAKDFLGNGKVILQIKDTKDKVYVEVVLSSQFGTSNVIIQGKHNQFVYLESRGEIMKDERLGTVQGAEKDNILYSLAITILVEAIESIAHKDIAFMLDGLHMNEAMAKAGLGGKVGMGVGFSLHENIRKGILSDDLVNSAMMLTAAASDARMSGVNLPVMSSNGSGNNGLTAILPIVAYRRKFDIPEDRLAKALAISHMVNSYIKHYIGRLSPLCGCAVAAGTGAGVAIAWLMGARDSQIDGVIKNILGNISGMVCDGAKVGCALKLSASASAAIQSALLAVDGYIIPAGNGIVGETAEETIRNLKTLSDEGMNNTDQAILKVMYGMQEQGKVI